MYKIFLNKKVIYIEERKESFSGNENYYVFSDKNKLKRFLKTFEKSRRTSVTIKSNSVGDLWNNFKSVFEIVESAGGLVMNSKNEFLFIYKNLKWDLPKGKKKKKEKIIDAAKREVSEECGIKNLKIIRELEPTMHIYKEDKKLFLKKTYWFEMLNETNEKPSPQTKEKIYVAEWIKIKDINKVLKNTYSSIEEIINNNIFKH